MASQAVVGKALGSISLLWKEILIAWSFIHITVLLFLTQVEPTFETRSTKAHFGRSPDHLICSVVITSTWSLTRSFPNVDIPRLPPLLGPAPHRCCRQASELPSRSYRTSASLATIHVLPAPVSGETDPCNYSSLDKLPPASLTHVL